MLPLRAVMRGGTLLFTHITESVRARGSSKASVHRGARGGYVALLDVLRRVLGELCRVPRRRKSIRLRADPSSL
eukprot:scaffold32480_cov68-Phaeocystis_antarctica.AAC.4